MGENDEFERHTSSRRKVTKNNEKSNFFVERPILEVARNRLCQANGRVPTSKRLSNGINELTVSMGRMNLGVERRILKINRNRLGQGIGRFQPSQRLFDGINIERFRILDDYDMEWD